MDGAKFDRTTTALTEIGTGMEGVGTLISCVRDRLEKGSLAPRRVLELAQALAVLKHCCETHSAALLDHIEELRDGGKADDPSFHFISFPDDVGISDGVR